MRLMGHIPRPVVRGGPAALRHAFSESARPVHSILPSDG